MEPHIITQELDAGNYRAVRALVRQGADCSFAIKSAAVDKRVDLRLLEAMALQCQSTPFGHHQVVVAGMGAIAQQMPERAEILLHVVWNDMDGDHMAAVCEAAIKAHMMHVVRMCVDSQRLHNNHLLGRVVDAVKAGSMEMFELLAARVTTPLPIGRLLDYSLHFEHPELRDRFLAVATDEDKLYAATQAAAWERWDNVLDMLRRCQTFSNQQDVDLLTLKAVDQGQTAVVSLLPAASDKEHEDMVGMAIIRNHMEIFELLLGRMKGHSKMASLINLASSHRRWDMAVLLCSRLVNADKAPKHLHDTLRNTLISACGARASDDTLERLCAICPDEVLHMTINKQQKSAKFTEQAALVKAHFDRRVLAAAVPVDELDAQSKKTRKM